MRIVGGRHSGRRLLSPRDRSIRPTSDRVREAVFGILEHGGWGGSDDPDAIAGAVVVDAFCGTGALGLEALSRGAAFAYLIDRDPVAAQLARRNATDLGEQDRVRISRCDVMRPPPPMAPANLAFFDPPYGLGLAEGALMVLQGRGWLAPGCLCVVEQSRRETPPMIPGFVLLDTRLYGDVQVTGLRALTGCRDEAVTTPARRRKSEDLRQEIDRNRRNP